MTTMKDTKDFGVNLPVGICSTCLARLSDQDAGMPARVYTLADGRKLWAVYCAEHQSGAWAVVGVGEVQWLIRTPIDVVMFWDYAATLPATIVMVQAGFRGDATH
jgi:hypothetical protein